MSHHPSFLAHQARPRARPGRGARARQQGLSLIELMVGVVLGMAAVVIVLQVFQLSEGSKRTAMGGDDAQNNGALALTALQRDLKQGGYGAHAFGIIGCDLTLLPSGRVVPNWGPVGINHPAIPAGDDDTDTLLVFYGTGSGAPEGNRIISQPGTAVLAVATPTAFAIGDRVVAVPPVRPASCNLALTEVLAVTSPSPPNVTVGAGTVAVATGLLFNMGPAPRLVAYAVRNSRLTVCDLLVADCGAATSVTDPTVWVPVGNNIVSLRAQYGRDTTPLPMDGVVDVFDQATPATACEWMRVSAVRIAVVARSAQFEREVVTNAIPTWSGSADDPLELDSLPQWQNYRYRTYETMVPLRNIAWQGGQPGC